VKDRTAGRLASTLRERPRLETSPDRRFIEGRESCGPQHSAPGRRAKESRASAPLRIAVGVATVGRPATVVETIAELYAQKRLPDEILVCAPTAADVEGVERRHPQARLLHGPRGLSAQRNEIIRNACGSDVVLFIDDDFVVCPGYLKAIEAAFAANKDVVLATGLVVADGILGPGLPFEVGRVLAHTCVEDDDRRGCVDIYDAYGCNMAVRLAPIIARGLRFDEALPLYAWLEDLDFSRQIARFGRIVQVMDARGIHLGIKSGRQSGVRLGYSQIANPIYLMRKGTCSRQRALRLMASNVAANVVKSVWPERYVDRFGRVIGNFHALIDFVGGRLAPSRILAL
jgi:GT2 family glycosyltransferase